MNTIWTTALTAFAGTVFTIALVYGILFTRQENEDTHIKPKHLRPRVVKKYQRTPPAAKRRLTVTDLTYPEFHGTISPRAIRNYLKRRKARAVLITAKHVA